MDNLNTLGEGSITPEKKESKKRVQFRFDSGSSSSSSIPSYLRKDKPQGSQEMLAGSARQSSGPSYSFVSGGGPSQQDFVPDQHQPIVRPNYLLYSDFEREKHSSDQRKPNVIGLSGRPKTVKSRIKKLASKLRRKGGFHLERIPEETDTEPNPYEDLLPKDDEGFSAVYGTYEGRGIHGPVNWDQYYETFDRIGTQYREKPGSRLQRTFPIIFGAPDKPLVKSQIKFLKEKGFTFKYLLGKGAFGQVWLVRQHLSEWSEGKQTKIDRTLACKIVSLKSLEERGGSVKRSIELITQEADVYSQLNHLNIVERAEIINLFDKESGFPQPIQILMFMELMEGDLYELIFNPKMELDFEYRQIDCGWTDNPEKFTHMWSKQIVSGLRYLHENNISHMDLKPENILYSTHMEGQHLQYIYKLTDFGLSMKFEPNIPSVTHMECGTQGYIAPEIGSGAMYETKKADIYSLGIIMAYSIASEQFDCDDTIHAIRHYDDTVGTQYSISRWFASLVASMIDPSPSLRPDILQVYNHHWIKMSFQDQDVESTRL